MKYLHHFNESKKRPSILIDKDTLIIKDIRFMEDIKQLDKSNQITQLHINDNIKSIDLNQIRKTFPNINVISNVGFHTNDSLEIIGDCNVINNLDSNNLILKGDYNTVRFDLNKQMTILIDGNIDKSIIRHYIESNKDIDKLVQYISSKSTTCVVNGIVIKADNIKKDELINCIEVLLDEYEICIGTSDRKVTNSDSCYNAILSNHRLRIKLDNNNVTTIVRLLDIIKYNSFNIDISNNNAYLGLISN